MASDFSYQVIQILRRNPDGSKSTQAERKKTLRLVDKQLQEMHVKKLQVRNLGRRHIDKLLNLWQSQGLSAGTIKNRMSHLRWLSEKLASTGLYPLTMHLSVLKSATMSQTSIDPVTYQMSSYLGSITAI
ncbi:hypothetical protein OLX65_08030 [Vibrio sp. TBRI6]